MKHGQIEIKLPDGVVLEIGVTQENKDGRMEVVDNYCWVVATHDDRSASMDSFNMGLKFKDESDIFVFEDRFTDSSGEQVRRLDVV